MSALRLDEVLFRTQLLSDHVRRKGEKLDKPDVLCRRPSSSTVSYGGRLKEKHFVYSIMIKRLSFLTY